MEIRQAVRKVTLSSPVLLSAKGQTHTEEFLNALQQAEFWSFQFACSKKRPNTMNMEQRDYLTTIIMLTGDKVDSIPPLAPASDSSTSVETIEGSPRGVVRVKSVSTIDSDTVKKDDVPTWLDACSPEISRHVRWGDAVIRKYPVMPGVHPDCAMGPPVRRKKALSPTCI
jgi:hypothetical protein